MLRRAPPADARPVPARERITSDTELVELAFDLYDAGEFDAMLALVADDATFDPVFYDGVPPRGIAEVTEFFKGRGDPRSHWFVRDRTVTSVGDWVLVTATLAMPGAIGAPLELPAAWIAKTRGGRLVRMHGFADRRLAVAAATAD